MLNIVYFLVPAQWYCSEMCFIASDAHDHVLNYTKALVWEGLYNLARRDAVREGDGEAMTDFWKMDMVLFWTRKHTKDFTKCHRLLTGRSKYNLLLYWVFCYCNTNVINIRMHLV